MKKRLWISLTLGILGLGAFFALYSNLDSLIRSAIESYGSRILGVQVKVAKVELDPSTGHAAIKGVAVSNPPNYKSSHAFVLDQIKVVLDVASLTKDVILIHQIFIDRPHLTYEVNQKGSNLQTLYQHIQQYTHQSEKDPKQRSPSHAQSSEKRLIIDVLQLKSMTATIDLPLLDQSIKKTLPDLQFAHLGRESEGATAKQIAEKFVQVLTQMMTRSIQKLGLDAMSGKNLQKQVHEKLRKALKGKKLPPKIKEQLKSLGGFTL